ncbi:hypothetical protein GPECTOR_65g214 [Gonium pectorale]|uniref:Uncharacterized protein n=1 Tax=Gonium pectorale TaxID=33097 RepID=A0A150G3Y7_GONPE|nr:hypothetical protein GPECTOR_65g214 [Gonium pectorale]|eukprot:KXZ44596.1 hypothetical protein GPECTOR_65g214 [Gonium pectorale]
MSTRRGPFLVALIAAASASLLTSGGATAAGRSLTQEATPPAPANGGSSSAPVGRGGLPPDQELVVRNFGGGHWNHQMFWKVMSPPGSANTSRDNISPGLQQAINGAFGSADSMLIMTLHHDFHEGVEYVGTLNAVLGPLAGTGSATLPDLIKKVGRGGRPGKGKGTRRELGEG